MSKLTKALSTIIICLCFSGIMQTSAQDQEMAKQYLKQKGMSDSEIKNIAKSRQKKQMNPLGVANQDLPSDSLAKADSLAKQIKVDPLNGISMYENILKNKTIDPDSLLKEQP